MSLLQGGIVPFMCARRVKVAPPQVTINVSVKELNQAYATYHANGK